MLGYGDPGGGATSAQHRSSGVNGVRTQFFLDAAQLVVFRQPVGAGKAAGLDLAATAGDRQIGDGGIFGFTRTV